MTVIRIPLSFQVHQAPKPKEERPKYKQLAMNGSQPCLMTMERQQKQQTFLPPPEFTDPQTGSRETGSRIDHQTSGVRMHVDPQTGSRFDSESASRSMHVQTTDVNHRRSQDSKSRPKTQMLPSYPPAMMDPYHQFHYPTHFQQGQIYPVPLPPPPPFFESPLQSRRNEEFFVQQQQQQQQQQQRSSSRRKRHEDNKTESSKKHSKSKREIRRSESFSHCSGDSVIDLHAYNRQG